MGAGALAVRQSKSTVRLKEDMKKIAVLPLNKQRDTTCAKVFGVSLLELQRQGLSRNGIPIVVWNIVEYLTQHGMTQEGLFRVNGSMKMVEQLRLQYERGEEVELVKDADVYSAASLLKLFLRELPDGIITSALHPRFIQLYKEDISRNDMQKEGYLKELLKELPDAHYCLLKYLCHFLIKVAEHHIENRMNLCNLATIFGPNCFHVPSGFEGMKEQEICNKIMIKMLENYNTLFELEGLKKDEEKPVCASGIILSKMTEPPMEQCSQMCLLLQPAQSDGIPQASLQLTDSGSCGKEMDLANEISDVNKNVFFPSHGSCMPVRNATHAGKHEFLYLFFIVMILTMLKETYEDAKEKTNTHRGDCKRREQKQKVHLKVLRPCNFTTGGRLILV